MRLTSLLLMVFILLSACKKNQPGSAENCPEMNRVQEQENTVPADVYIVTLKNLPANLVDGLPTSYKERSMEWKTRVETWLNQKSIGLINTNAVFSGVFYGFEAKLSAIQVTVLATDPMVDLIEGLKPVSMFQNCSSAPVDMGSQQISYGTTRVGSGNGTGKRVWVFDTGIDVDHPDLTVNVNLSRDFTRGAIGGTSGAAAIDDLEGHGTHVSGIIAAKNNGIGTLGVAAGAEIVALRVLDSVGVGNSSTVIQGLDYLFMVGLPGEVANMSLGGGVSLTVDLAVQRVSTKGLFFAIAAGNDRSSASNYSPARAEGNRIYTISAIDQNDFFSSYSNFGNPPVDYAEPGNSILSTFKGGKYILMSGTSMAAPHMAGILLLKGGSFSTDGSASGDPDGSPDRIAVAR